MSQRVTTFILNCSPSMNTQLAGHEKTAFQEGIDVILDSLGEKILAGRKTDKASVIFAGCEETDNVLAAENPSQYEHVAVVCGIGQPDVGLLRHLLNFTPSTVDFKADILDALILAIHTVVKEYGRLRYTKQIVLITDATDPIDWRDIQDVKSMLQNEHVKLVVIGVGFDGNGVIKDEDEDTNLQRIKEVNQRNWKALCRSVEGSTIYSLLEAYENAKGMKTKEFKPTASFRGFLNLGDAMAYGDRALSISVHMFPLVSEAKPPTTHKWSTLSDLAADKQQQQQDTSSSEISTLTHGVNMIRKYRLKDTGATTANGTGDESQPSQADTDASVDVDENALEKVYPFGKTLVKITQQEEEYLRLQTTPGIWIHGFLHKSAVPREYLMSRVYVLVAGTYSPEASGMAIAALCRSLYEKDAVALVRYVSRANSEPKMGIISPYVDVDINLLQYCQVPFGEDLRQFTFKSLDKVTTKSGKVITEDHPLLPTPEMKQSMATFVEEMTVMKQDDLDEHWVPEEVFNPVIWRTNTAIKKRALNEAAPIPDIHPKLKQNMTRNPELDERYADHMKQMASLFNVKKVEAVKTKKRRYGGETTTSAADSSQLRPIETVMTSTEGTDMKRSRPDGDTIMVKPTLAIGATNPVKDFYAMLADEQDLVTDAVTQMTELVLRLMGTSFGDQHYDRIIACLKAFREAAARENEAGTFNQCLIQLKRMVDPSNNQSTHIGFWHRLQNEKLSLITKDEADDDEVASVTKADADKFLNETREDTQTSMLSSSKPEEKEEMSTEDLLAMMD